jgi:hypothetical protein
MALNIPKLDEDITSIYNQKNQAEKDLSKLEKINLQTEQEIINTENQFGLLEQKFTPLKEKYNELEFGIDSLNIQLGKLNHVPEITSNPVSEIDQVIKNFNIEKRAMFLFNLWGLEDEDSLEILESIKHHGFYADYQNNEGVSLLKKAARISDTKLLELILSQDKKSAEEITLLNYALENSNNEFIIKLLAAKADYTYGVEYIVTEYILKSFQKILPL